MGSVARIDKTGSYLLMAWSLLGKIGRKGRDTGVHGKVTVLDAQMTMMGTHLTCS